MLKRFSAAKKLSSQNRSPIWRFFYISSCMKIGPGVSELWGVENRPLPLTRPMAYTIACTTVQAVIESLTIFILPLFCGVDEFI